MSTCTSINHLLQNQCWMHSGFEHHVHWQYHWYERKPQETLSISFYHLMVYQLPSPEWNRGYLMFWGGIWGWICSDLPIKRKQQWPCWWIPCTKFFQLPHSTDCTRHVLQLQYGAGYFLDQECQKVEYDSNV